MHIPVGTDIHLGVQGRYPWLAGKVDKPSVKALVQSNLEARVLDAENIGYSFKQHMC